MEVVPARLLRRKTRESALASRPPQTRQELLANGVKLQDTIFGRPDKEAIAFMSDRSASLVSGMDDTTLGRLRDGLALARQDGLSSEKTAELLKSVLPQLDASTALRHLESRAHLIAVTEMSTAYNAGNEEAVERLTSLGAAFVKEWIAVGDDGTCDICSENEDAGEIGVDDLFPGSETTTAPGHPGCRCTVVHVPQSMEELAVKIDDFVAAQAPDAPPVPDDLIAPPEPDIPPVPEIVVQAGDNYRPANYSSLDASNFPEKYDPWKARTGKTDGGEDGDIKLGYLNEMQGYDRPPTVVDSVDELIANGWEETWRGVAAPPGYTGPSYATQFREGDFFPGYGIYGNGTYTALGKRRGTLGGVDWADTDFDPMPGIEIAEGYSDLSTRGGEIMRMAVNPNGRFIDSRDLNAEIKGLRDRVINGEATPGETYSFVLAGDDPGRYATLLGYDGIIVSERGFLVVLNRTLVAVERKNYAPSR